ncbi:hypothetical protein [Nocardia crassostreae]|uniref:hypothetical protein n=1 Tax=Nocardia crassostreae TaxID=53428 RepID=UPI0012FC4D1E|nr:hypothetical protein [Nocardia crassostreae]
MRKLLEGCGTPTTPGRHEGRPARNESGPGIRERQRLLIEAILPELADESVLSHQSAAVLYGTALWRTPLDRVCVTRNRRGGGRTRPHTKVYGSPLDSVAEVDGLLVTTPARTVVDLALTLPFDAAVVAGDALAGMFGLTPDDPAEELARAKFRHGITRAKQAVAFVDGRSRSAGESLSRAMIRRCGLPPPATQGTVLTPDGRFITRADFYYEQAGVICQFDGPIYYGRALRHGHDPAEVVHREQARETYLRALGFHVVRWTWNDLRTDEPGRRLRAALTRGRRDRPDARIEPTPAVQARQVPTHPL